MSDRLIPQHRVDECNCVAVGTFNIYLFQPQLIAKTSGLPADSEFEVEGDFSQPGLLIRHTNPSIEWVIRPDRIMISSLSPDVDCGRHIESILNLLPVTPIRAVGSNFTFSVPLDDTISEFWKHKFLNPPIRISEGQHVSSGFGFATSIDDAVHNVGITCGDHRLSVKVNINRNVVDASEGAKKSVKFNLDKKWATELLHNVLAGEQT